MYRIINNAHQLEYRKNHALKETQGICFEDVIFSIEKGTLLDDYQHPNQQKYPGQRIMVVGINKYAYLVPYIENEDELSVAMDRRRNSCRVDILVKGASF